MKNSILAELEFASIIGESQAQTQTGENLLNGYKAYLMNNEATYGLVNNFVKEAQYCTYDSGVNEALATVADYINSNKTVWALASTCESINANTKSYNFINRQAAKQVESLLENIDEETAVKYIKAGALKNVMHCESFRSIAKQVFKEQPMVEATADATIEHPVSMVENVGDGLCFEVAGTLYKMGDDKSVQEAQWNEVTTTFKTVSSLLESNMVTVDCNTITIKTNNAEYEITEAGKCKKKGKDGEKEMSVDQLKENNNLVLMTTSPRLRPQVAQVLESIAILCENYNNVATMDNVSIYNTKNDRFVVIEAGSNMYATLLASNRNPKWTINENAVDAVAFIKTKTNVNISENHKETVAAGLEAVSEQEKENIEKELNEQKILGYKERIELLTEKFKNDPAKLAVLSQCAQNLTSLE